MSDLTAVVSTHLHVERCDEASWVQGMRDVPAHHVTPFHTWEWSTAQTRLSGMVFEPIACADRATGARWLVPIFIQDGVVASSVFGYGGPVALDGVPMTTDVLQGVVHEVTGSFLARMSLAPDSASTVIDEHDPAWSRRETYIAGLDADFERFWARIDGAARTGARYGPSRGVRIESLRCDDWKTLSQWQNAMLEANGATYRMNNSFLLGLRDHVSRDVLVALGAYRDDTLLGASVFVYGEDTVHYWLHVSSPTGKRLQVQDALVCAALRSACSRGLQAADLGAAPSSAHVAPKRRWGAVPSETYTYFGRPSC